MLIAGLLIYLGITVALGLWSARRVHEANDFLLAGRRLGMGFSTATLFATWFGAETIIGASSEMAEKGILGIIEDPLGAALCLLLLGLFFAKPLYRLNLLTFGDFYALNYGQKTANVASIVLLISYFGWISGQIAALGVIFHEVVGVEEVWGSLIGTGIVVFYTFYGGMWSVATLDIFQNSVIVAGLLAILIWIGPDLWSMHTYEALPSGYFSFFPSADLNSWMEWLGAWMVIGLGSLPGQDIFQRVMSSKSPDIAQRSAFLASVLYMIIGAMPLCIATYVKVYHPEMLHGEASQNMLVKYVMGMMPAWIQLLFIGALISAIMSSASGAIMAPASIFAENIYPLFYGKPDDARLLRVSRLAVVGIGILSFGLTLLNNQVFELVRMSAAISGVSLLVPMVYGLFGWRHTSTGALISITLGLSTYFIIEFGGLGVPSMFIGIMASWLGMIVGNLVELKMQ